MCINNLDTKAKKEAIGDLDRIPYAHDQDVVAAILRAYTRNPSFKVINAVLSRHGMPMSESEFKALLVEHDKRPKGTLGARGSPQDVGRFQAATPQPNSPALASKDTATSSDTESITSRIWTAAHLRQPMDFLT